MEEKTKRDLRNVMVVALADGKLAEEEKRFIEKLRDKLGLDKSEFLELVGQVRKQPKSIALPRDGKAAREAVGLLVEAARADGVISSPEERLLKRIAERVGSVAAQIEAALRTEPPEDNADEVNARVDEIYAAFAGWDETTRRSKITELADLGGAASLGLLHLLESYRVPDGMDNALEMKMFVAEQLGRLGDSHAAYYLAQQVNIGDTDDQVSNAALRHAAAEALGKIVGESFTRDQSGVEAAREWWRGPGAEQYDRLAF